MAASEARLAEAARIVDLTLTAVRDAVNERLRGGAAVGGVPTAIVPADGGPLGALRATDEDRQALLAAVGETWTREHVMRHLGVGEDVVEVLELSGLLGLERPGSGEIVYPAWQFSEHGLQSWLKPVAQAFQEAGILDPWVRADILLSENAFLQGRPPLEALRSGEVDAVGRAVRWYGRQAAP
ncbi:MAG: hypothetical protein ACRDJN_28035 [Chloroflexota bacterium]